MYSYWRVYDFTIKSWNGTLTVFFKNDQAKATNAGASQMLLIGTETLYPCSHLRKKISLMSLKYNVKKILFFSYIWIQMNGLRWSLFSRLMSKEITSDPSEVFQNFQLWGTPFLSIIFDNGKSECFPDQVAWHFFNKHL